MPSLNDLSSYAATIVRLGRGLRMRVSPDREAPSQALELYEFEGCPYCRKVREALCELNLDYHCHPVARGSRRRAALVRLGGKMQVPFLVDPNTGTQLYESDAINQYLTTQYGGGISAGWQLPLLDNLGSMMATALRLGRGIRCLTDWDKSGLELLTLYNMEGSPYCRKVRESLSALDLEHIVCSVPKGSPKRAELEQRGGKVQVPYLVDPNTGIAMYESDDIVLYLETQYAAGDRRSVRQKVG